MAYDMNWSNAEHSTFVDSVQHCKDMKPIGISKEKLHLEFHFMEEQIDGLVR